MEKEIKNSFINIIVHGYMLLLFLILLIISEYTIYHNIMPGISYYSNNISSLDVIRVDCANNKYNLDKAFLE
jgi:hypothetical protein